MKPRHLLVGELNYELRIRGVESNRDVNDKRKILTKLLSKERNRNHDTEDPNFDFDRERIDVVNTIDNIGNTIKEFEGPASDFRFSIC